MSSRSATLAAVFALTFAAFPPVLANTGQGARPLEEVIVTARKREESIQSIPVAVTPFTAAEMEQRGFGGLEDIAAATPGFSFEGYVTGGAHGNAVIRGVAQQFATARIQNVSAFLDGVYLQRQSMINLGLIDMERIEVVKGPQNALYGRNAFAGAINYITLRPRIETQSYISVSGGDNERQELRFSVNGALDRDATLFGKLTYGDTRYDGHTRNDHPLADANPPGPNMRGNLGGWDDVTYSLSLAWEPNEKWRIRGSYYHSDLEHESTAGYSISGVGAARFSLRFDHQNDLNCNEITVPNIGDPSKSHTGFSAYCGELPAYASDIAVRTREGVVIDPRASGSLAKTDAVTLTVDYQLSEAVSLNYLFGYADHESVSNGGASDEDPLAGRGIVTNALITAVDNQNEAGFSFVNTSGARPNSILESFSHELRVDWQWSDTVNSSFGVYYSQVEDEEWTTLYLSDLCNNDSAENRQNCNEHLSTPNSLEENTVLTAGVAYDQYTRQHGGQLRGEWTRFEDDIQAIFGSVTVDISDRLNATLEARYTIENKAITRFTDPFMLRPGETVTYNPPQHPVIPLLGNSLTSSIVVPEDDARFDYFTPRAIVNWAVTDQQRLYASIAKGVKSGGFNNAISSDELTYDESENWTYELGSKNTLAEGKITLNASLYYIDWQGLQGGQPPAIAGLLTSDIVANIGDAASVGLEVEAVYRMNDALSLDMGLAYNDTRYAGGVKYSAGHQDTGNIHCDGITCPADGDVGGNQIARTSKEQFSLGLNYRGALANWVWAARVDTSYQSRQYITPLNLAWVPDRQLWNASLNLRSPSEHWELNLWGKNLTDEDYAANAFFIGVFNQYLTGKGARRTWGLSLKYNF